MLFHSIFDILYQIVQTLSNELNKKNENDQYPSLINYFHMLQSTLTPPELGYIGYSAKECHTSDRGHI